MLNQETDRPQKTEPRLFYGYVVVVAAFFIMLLGMGFYNTFGVFFKPIITEFGWSRALTSGAFSLSSVFRGLMGIVMGRFTDRLGARTVLTLCGILIGAGYLLVSQVNHVWELYLLYVLLIGVGMGGVWVPLLSTVARWFTRRRSMMTGIVVSGLNISVIIMPLVANWLISLYDWRVSYLIMGGILLVVIVSAAQFLRREPTLIKQVSQPKSAGGEKGPTPAHDGFTLREAVYTGQFWLSAGMMFCTGLWRISVLVHIVPHVTDFGYSAGSATNVLAIIGVISILGSVIGGAISDRIGSRQAYIVSFILMAASSLWLLPAKEMWMFYLFAIIFGLGSGVSGPLLSPLVADIFGLKSHGAIFGANNFTYTIGAAAGPFLTGYIFDVSGSYQVAFLVNFAVSVAGLILAVILRPVKHSI